MKPVSKEFGVKPYLSAILAGAVGGLIGEGLAMPKSVAGATARQILVK